MMTLAQARTKAGISKREMCDKLGVSRPTYDAYERDPYHKMTIGMFRAACKIIGVDTSEIFFDSHGK